MVVKIAVVGAGVIGLSTALNVQRRVHGAEVKVIAEKFDQDTTSFGSGGIWFPTYSAFQNEPESKVRKWCKDSWEFFRLLATGPEAGKSGALISNGVVVTRKEYTDAMLQHYVFCFRKMKDEDFKQFNFPSEFKHGYNATTIIMDQTKYLQWLTKRFKQNGGTTEQRKIFSFKEFIGQYDIVVNCTGLGSRELVGDDTIYPVRGQVIKVKAPWARNWFCNPESIVSHQTFIIPGENLVTLGSTKQVRDENLEVDPEDTEDILQRCTTLCPHLKHAEIDHVWVGLRPMRPMIRIEAEEMRFNHQKLKVVHNYGHYSNGVAVSWGTSVEAADLVKKSLATPKANL